MEKGNILVIGDAGSGKTILVKTVVGEEITGVTFGKSRSASELCIYETDDYRIIDTVGFEASFLKAHASIASVQKWCKEQSKSENREYSVNVIWLCLDSTAPDKFQKTEKELLNSVLMWKDVPIIVMLTKSHDEEARINNIDKVIESFSKLKAANSVASVIPVITKSEENEEMISDFEDSQLGIDDLLNDTNSVMPEGIKKGGEALLNYKLRRKRAMAQSLIISSIAAGATVGAVPLPFPDAGILTAIEGTEVKGISKIYEFTRENKSEALVKYIVDLGTVSVIAKSFIQAIKLIPGLSLVGAPLNALVAGLIVCTIGESSAYIYEKIYTGEKNADDLKWVESVVKEKMDKLPVEEIIKEIELCGKKVGINDVIRIIRKVQKYRKSRKEDQMETVIFEKKETAGDFQI